ncbi:nucleotidyltransferase domain-containing protein, partial [Porphyromonas pogonae]|uniref:nucleotidyltransferase domain-containing protein n=1 Tax=Porphyromonas pogonae TaxID=867595 RepID=UPI00300F506E
LLTDGVIANLFAVAVESIAPDGAGQAMAVVATGGYGRSMLAPFSDIDLLFLTESEPAPAARRVVEFMLYLLWDLGLKVGHATRSIEECIAD